MISQLWACSLVWSYSRIWEILLVRQRAQSVKMRTKVFIDLSLFLKGIIILYKYVSQLCWFRSVILIFCLLAFWGCGYKARVNYLPRENRGTWGKASCFQSHKASVQTLWTLLCVSLPPLYNYGSRVKHLQGLYTTYNAWKFSLSFPCCPRARAMTCPCFITTAPTRRLWSLRVFFDKQVPLKNRKIACNKGGIRKWTLNHFSVYFIQQLSLSNYSLFTS